MPCGGTTSVTTGPPYTEDIKNIILRFINPKTNRMKKIYSLMLALAVAALGANAAVPAKQFRMNTEFKLNTAKTVKLATPEKVEVANAPAAADVNAPASLLNQKFYISYSIIEYDQQNQPQVYDVTSPVTFSGEQEESGAKYYLMSGFLANNYGDALTFPDIEVGYLPSTGELVIFSDNTIIEYQGMSFTPYSGNDNVGFFNMNILFKYSNGGFTMVNPVDVKTQEGTQTVDIQSVVIGMVDENGLNSLIELGSDWTFVPYDLYGLNKFTGAISTGAREFEGDTYANLEPSKLIVTGFAQGMVPEITFDINTTDKTLSATNIDCGQQNFGDDTQPLILGTYMSEADNVNLNELGTPSNKYPNQSKVVATYAITEGKTVVTFPDWNVFANNGTVELAIYVPFSATTITFDGNLEDMVAGVKDITTAPAEADADAPVEYFNLQGVRVAEPAAGLYIRRQGNNVSKVVIR